LTRNYVTLAEIKRLADYASSNGLYCKWKNQKVQMLKVKTETCDRVPTLILEQVRHVA
jgi:hypothetical protein